MSKASKSDLLAKVTSAVVGLSVFAVCTYWRGADFGAVAAFAFIAIGVAAYTRWDLHQEPYYWPILSLIGLAHLFLLMRLNMTLPKPTIILAPLVFLDFVLIVAVLSITERFWRSAD